jgi:hypothetical protein
MFVEATENALVPFLPAHETATDTGKPDIVPIILPHFL